MPQKCGHKKMVEYKSSEGTYTECPACFIPVTSIAGGFVTLASGAGVGWIFAEEVAGWTSFAEGLVDVVGCSSLGLVISPEP